MAVGGAIGMVMASPKGDSGGLKYLAICGLLAAAPDLDLLFSQDHRTFTHSLAATALVGLSAATWQRLVRSAADWRLAAAYACAYGSHLLTDYFGVDNGTPAGLQILWPRAQWFISEWSLFLGTERRNVLSVDSIVINGHALLREFVIIGPVFWLAWTRYRRSRQHGVTGA